MSLKKIKRAILNHPKSIQAAKFFLSREFIVNSFLYKNLVRKKAKRVARENREYKENICLENILTCNARCVFCAHHNKTLTGIMSWELFKKIIDECYAYGINNVTLGVYGETLLDKDLFKKIESLRKYEMTYGLITNASLLTPATTNEIFKLGGLTSISFSVNAFSREVYEKTMVGLRREITYKNILYFLEQKEKLKLKDVTVTVTAVETEINKKDFKRFYQFWSKQKGVFNVLSAELIDRMGQEYDGKIGKLGPLTKKNNWLSPCRQLWGPLNVYYDGKVGPCCKDNDKRELIVGDLNKQTVREVATGAALNNLRELHLAGHRKNHPVCGKCYLNSIWLR